MVADLMWEETGILGLNGPWGPAVYLFIQQITDHVQRTVEVVAVPQGSGHPGIVVSGLHCPAGHATEYIFLLLLDHTCP